MPTESRFIHFSEPELLQALRSYSVVGDTALRPGLTFRARVESVPEFRVMLDVVDEMGKVRQSEILQKVPVVAALLKYCMANHIPVPKLGKKNLKLCDSGVSLYVTLEEC